MTKIWEKGRPLFPAGEGRERKEDGKGEETSGVDERKRRRNRWRKVAGKTKERRDGGMVRGE